jgi:hypothetical protein
MQWSFWQHMKGKCLNQHHTGKLIQQVSYLHFLTFELTYVTRIRIRVSDTRIRHFPKNTDTGIWLWFFKNTHTLYTYKREKKNKENRTQQLAKAQKNRPKLLPLHSTDGVVAVAGCRHGLTGPSSPAALITVLPFAR